MHALVLSESHSLVRVLIARLRNRDTKPPQFREGIHQVSLLLAPQALDAHLTFEEETVQTPLEDALGMTVGNAVALVPIMRAGSGMLPAFLTFVPDAAVWHVSMSRDENTLEPNFSGSKIPGRTDEEDEPRPRVCFVLDPMLATGGSASLAIQKLKDAGAQSIVFVGIFAAPEGVNRLEVDHPDVPVIIAVLDRELNEKGYILPGCGDAGDRQFPIF